MSIHKRIKARRLALGMESHQALATLLGVTWTTVQQWEKEGGTAPKRARMEQVAKALQCSVSWLQNGDEAPIAVPSGTEINAPKLSLVEKPSARELQWVSPLEATILSEIRARSSPVQETVLTFVRSLPRVVAEDESAANQS